jgi:uracil-DNA glycosylase
MGLSFSVPKNHRLIPPSLKNIFKEIKNSYPDYEIPKHGLLKKWAKREKILLLNSALSVQSGNSNSHALLWQDFTDKLINWFQKQNDKCIFLLMGNNAKSKANLIDSKKHKIFITIHPSPLSAHRGFFGCGVFKEINEYLKLKDLDEINY